IALFAGLDQLAERRLMAALAAARGHRFGVHAGDKQRVVADVLAEGALGVERGRAAVDRIGRENHLREPFNGMTHFIAHLVEIFRFGKLAEQTGDIGGYVRIVEPQLAFVAVPYDLLEERFERMRLWIQCLHTHLPWPREAAAALWGVGWRRVAGNARPC